MSIENPGSEEIVEINGRKFKKKYVGDMVGVDDGEPLTEKRYFSHTGPGWDSRWSYLEMRGVDDVKDLSDEPFIYNPVD